jgi:ABC-type transport system involved in multi-copper enzyme maturation permease subunit
MAKGGAMKWLFWRDFRHNRPIVIFGLILLLLPHVLALYAIHCWAADGLKRPWQAAFARSGFLALIASQLTVALVAGNAIAGERVDRSAEFLASLPITRRKILASKLLFALAITTIIWMASTFVISAGMVTTEPTALRVFGGVGGGVREMLCALAAVAVSGVAIFGLAWLLSSLTASPTIAVCGGLVTPWTVWLGTLFVYFHLVDPHRCDDYALGLWYVGICLGLGIAGFVGGTWYYLRRVEP